MPILWKHNNSHEQLFQFSLIETRLFLLFLIMYSPYFRSVFDTWYGFNKHMALSLKHNELLLQPKDDLIREGETQGNINIKHYYNINRSMIKISVWCYRRKGILFLLPFGRCQDVLIRRFILLHPPPHPYPPVS